MCDIQSNASLNEFQFGVMTLSSGVQQLDRNSARAGLGDRGRTSTKFNSSPTRLGIDMSVRRRQTNAAAARLNVRGTPDILQLHAAPTGRHLQLPVALANFHTAPARFHSRALSAGFNEDASSAGFGNHL